ncbi:hypothetical protein SAMN05444365_103324 [Micromonospora pattaloongensis]|uniref:Uncharacterized protein n=1 Tax=Micromonospora pattaloongensis TaxID=405436 RepID=A0A1H3MDQ9_9ACTN|nr:hypothetical protein SAMN05444365_103324 [Micromonospora pattaloongensis]
MIAGGPRRFRSPDGSRFRSRFRSPDGSPVAPTFGARGAVDNF